MESILSPPPMPRSRQKCKSSPIRGLLLELFPFEEDRKILSSSGFICEPTRSLRGFKLINQSTDIELNLYLGLETLQSALNGREAKGRCAAPAIAQGCLPWWGIGLAVQSLSHSDWRFSEPAPWTNLVMCGQGLRRRTSILFPGLTI